MSYVNPCHEASESLVSVTWKDGTQTRRCGCGGLFTAHYGQAWKYREGPAVLKPRVELPIEELISPEDYL